MPHLFVLITGGSSGIGLATARECVTRGDSVALVARNQEKLEQACKALAEAAEHEVSIIAIPLDVLDGYGIARAVGDLSRRGLAPDIVINSAGVVTPGRFEDISPESFRRQIEVNLMGTVNVCRAVVPGMKARGSGAIINVASVAGFLGIHGMTAYCAAKFAVVGFSEALRQELAPHGVQVGVVCPPDTDTPMFREEIPLRPAATQELAGGAKPIPAEQVARAILDGIAAKTFMILPDMQSRLIHRISGLAPGLVRRVMDRKIRNAER